MQGGITSEGPNRVNLPEDDIPQVTIQAGGTEVMRVGVEYAAMFLIFAAILAGVLAVLGLIAILFTVARAEL
ncbi:MAG: hypothetical protein GEU28_05925 [Dehalococcoidia bacterium]|nr:hypothetical protein [Dehalococcoidia bacterium]